MTQEVTYQSGAKQRTAVVERRGDAFTVRVGDAVFALTARAGENGRLDLEVDGRRLRAYVVRVDGEPVAVARLSQGVA